MISAKIEMRQQGLRVHGAFNNSCNRQSQSEICGRETFGLRNLDSRNLDRQCRGSSGRDFLGTIGRDEVLIFL